MCSNKEIGSFLFDISLCLELTDDNPFRVASFLKASRLAQDFSESLSEYAKLGKLKSIKGIGDAIAENIHQFCQKKTSDYYEELKTKIPEGIFDILEIKGLGVKKVRELWELLSITNMAELEYACVENRLVSLKGFGKKTQDKIIAEIEKIKFYKNFMLYYEAEQIVNDTIEKIHNLDGAARIEVSGDFRRCLPVIENILFVTDKEINLKLHKSVSIIAGTKDDFAVKLFKTTGSEGHVNAIGSVDGVFKSEEEIYASKGYSFIPPEIREIEQDLDLYTAGKESVALITKEDIKGVIHSHTVYSDGANSIEELALASKEAGYEYLCISDHSKSAYYAGGLSEDEILKQREEIFSLNRKLAPFKIFSGIESDILKDGSLDYSNEVLKGFDFVIASVHSVFNLSKEDMTKRIVAAVNNPYTTILGHPTGRLLLGREGYELDIGKVIDECLKTGTVIEINANPHRLDLDWRNVIKAKKRETLFSVNPDAHSLSGIGHIKYGVMVARKGGLTKDDVINTKTAKEIEVFFTKLKGSRNG